MLAFTFYYGACRYVHPMLMEINATIGFDAGLAINRYCWAFNYLYVIPLIGGLSLLVRRVSERAYLIGKGCVLLSVIALNAYVLVYLYFQTIAYVSPMHKKVLPHLYENKAMGDGESEASTAQNK